MDSLTFDRIAKALSGITPRREALRAAIGAGATAAAMKHGDISLARKKRRHKKRCRKIGQTCGGKQKCCTGAGNTLCQPFENSECFGVDLEGLRCCGTEGTRCDPTFGQPGAFGNCSCCSPLFCGEQMDGSFRCQTEDT